MSDGHRQEIARLKASLARLRAENEELVEQVALMREQLVPLKFATPPGLPDLTCTERIILGCLVARDEVSLAYLRTTLLVHRPDSDELARSTVYAHITKLRRKLALVDASIETLWGVGWRLRGRELFVLGAAT